jgi:hypothetical protein
MNNGAFLVACVLAFACSCDGPVDTSPCIETYLDGSTAAAVAGEAEISVSADEDDITVESETVALRFPRIGAVSGFTGSVHSGPANVSFNALELGAIIEVRDLDGVLVLAAGETGGLPPGQPAIVAANRDPTSVCSESPVDGSFAGAEFRNATPPTVLAAGEEAVLTIEGRSYLAGVPWAFVSRDGTYSGWSYVMSTR